MSGDEPSAPAATAPTPERPPVGLATPVPGLLYIHDDLTDEVSAQHGPGSDAARLARALIELVQRDRGRVRVITEGEQLGWLLARGEHRPFATAVGVGRAGERVARRVHERAGWFPRIQRVDVTREEDGEHYRIVSASAEPLSRQVARLDLTGRIAVVDDTIFSGLTMRSVLEQLPRTVLATTHVFCLRAVAESLPSISRLCPVTAGLAAPGRILEDVSFINASGLVRRVAIRRAGQPPMAFFERAEWMRAWFSGHDAEVTALCRELNARLEPSSPA